MHFDRWIGIDYSGAGTSDAPQPGIEMYAALRGAKHPLRRLTPADIDPQAPRRAAWSRRQLAEALTTLLTTGTDSDSESAEGAGTPNSTPNGTPQRAIVGIDHCFSLPLPFFRANAIEDWDALLHYVAQRWPSDRGENTVEQFRREIEAAAPKDSRDRLRMTERWTSTAKSAFVLQGAGQVGKSSFAGMVWLDALRRWVRAADGRVHFWPFDGFFVPDDHHVVVEVYPSLFWRRFPAPSDATTPHRRDAAAVARWLHDMDRRDALRRYFDPPLTEEERSVAIREGWVLGVT